ncbi:Transposase [Thermoplasmatales archaeon]|nr:Transposase [Thermoplasmatales archaeon]
MIRQSGYEEFMDSINSLIEEYREKFSTPTVTDWKEYKRATGWKIFQRRGDRIETSIFIKGLWHNLMFMNG